MKLQSRDKRLIELIYKYGVLTTAQVRRLCFDGISHSTAMRRLRKLEATKVLLRMNGLEDGLLAWTLTTDGAQRVGLDRPLEYRNKNILKHTVTLADLRMTLEKTGLGESWISEIELRRKMYNAKDLYASERLVPDGLFAAKVFGETKMVALELELSLKTRARYQELFNQYARKSSIGLIWYVVESKTLAESLLRIWESTHKYKTSPKLVISLLGEVLRGPVTSYLIGLHETKSVGDVFGIKLLTFPAHEGAQGVSKLTKATLSTHEICESQIKSTG